MPINFSMHSNSPLVSVIIPVYNAEKFLANAILSVIGQSYNNLEIIIINDCSADSSFSILKQFQQKDQRIIILENNDNLGISKTLNKGIVSSKGKYIARMDADDVCFKDRIEKQVNFLEQNLNIAICGGSFLKIDEHDKVIGKISYPVNDAELRAELLFYCPFAHPTMMIRKSSLDATGLYNDLAPAEDYELWLQMAEKFEIANLPQNLIYYRVHANNSTIVQRNKMNSVLQRIVLLHTEKFGFSHQYLKFHLKFLEGTWYEKISVSEISEIKRWKKELLTLHQHNPFFMQVFNKYISLGMLSILKSGLNTLTVKMAALRKLLSINPLITIKHFFR